MTLDPSFDAKERVRQAVDIVELVGAYLPLRREGRAYKGLCPWHDDARPSFTVNPERQTFRCWPCDIGGDIFTFVMRMESLTFPEALAMLAERAGIDLGSARGSAPADAKKLLFQAMAWAEEQFHHCLLHSNEAAPARDYLASRGISEESVGRFRLGYSPNQWDWLVRRAQETPYTAKILEAVGLLSPKREGPGHVDRFRGRVLFPIHDPQGRSVGVGGRVLPGDPSPAKYVNSPETPLFSKSNLLYGLDMARQAIDKSDKTVLVMEGYTDVIIAHQCGITNAVAVLGTALGERHIPVLRRFADHVVLVLDGDEAGRRRTDQILELFIAEAVDLRVLTLPDELDPCDFLLNRGADEFRRLANLAADALEHRFQLATSGVDWSRGGQSALDALEQILGALAKAPKLRQDLGGIAKVKEDQVLQRVAQRCGVSEARVRARLAELRRAARRSRDRAKSETSVPERIRFESIGAWDRELVELLLRHPEGIHLVRDRLRLEDLAPSPCREIVAHAIVLSEAGHCPTLERLLGEFDTSEMKSLLVRLDESGAAKPSDPAARLNEWLDRFLRRIEDRCQVEDTRALREGRVDDHGAKRLLADMVERQRARHGISASTDG